MGTKTYRIEKELSDIASSKAIEYIGKNKEMITEAQVINASIKKGLEVITEQDIKNYVNKK